jgi:hypothetical protein
MLLLARDHILTGVFAHGKIPLFCTSDPLQRWGRFSIMGRRAAGKIRKDKASAEIPFGITAKIRNGK